MASLLRDYLKALLEREDVQEAGARILLGVMENLGRPPSPEEVRKVTEALEAGEVVTLQRRKDGTYALDVEEAKPS